MTNSEALRFAVHWTVVSVGVQRLAELWAKELGVSVWWLLVPALALTFWSMPSRGAS